MHLTMTGNSSGGQYNITGLLDHNLGLDPAWQTANGGPGKILFNGTGELQKGPRGLQVGPWNKIADVNFVSGNMSTTRSDLQNGDRIRLVVNAGARNFISNETVVSVTPSTPPPAAGSDYTSANIGILKYVPAGTFQRDATPANTSYVSAFRMSRYEITRAQFAAIMGADPSDVQHSSGMNDPVQQANWYHAIAFCNKLSIREGLTPAYAVTGVDFPTLTFAAIPTGPDSNWNAATCNWSANGYRLPTEMEWMWAAMGANIANPWASNTTGYTKQFAGSNGSNAVGDYAWYSGNSSKGSKQVGTKLANELGLFDMSGNVWEWCWDRYGTYPTNLVSDYRGAGTGSTRVMRGGCWIDYFNPPDGVAVDLRNGNIPSNQYYFVGFRVVRP